MQPYRQRTVRDKGVSDCGLDVGARITLSSPQAITRRCRMRTRRLWSALSIGASLTLVGCSSSDSDTGAQSGAGAGTQSGPGAGTGGSASSSSSATSSGGGSNGDMYGPWAGGPTYYGKW